MQSPKAPIFGKSTFDILSEEYWQAYQQRAPIAGGVAYQKKLYELALDESLESLKVLDKMLLAVKKDLQTRQYGEQVVLSDASFRHFLQFVGMYAGRVLAHELGESVSWQSAQVFAKRYAHTPLATQTDDIYNQVALIAQSALKAPQIAPLFLLMTIGACLFGSQERHFKHPVTASLVVDSLYMAVTEYLSQIKTLTSQNVAHGTQAQPINKLSAQETTSSVAPPPQQPATIKTAQSPSAPPTQSVVAQMTPTPVKPVEPRHHSVPDMAPPVAPLEAVVPTLTLIPDEPLIQIEPQAAPQVPHQTPNQAISKPSATQWDEFEIDPDFDKALASTVSKDVSSATMPTSQISTSATNNKVASAPVAEKPTAQAPIQQPVDLVVNTATTTAPSTSLNPKVSRPKTPKASDTSIFGEVTKDIKMLPATNTTRQADYEQALAVVEQFDETVAKKVVAGETEIVFSEAEVENLQKAVSQIDNIATEGNTNAMLSLALCYFKGIGQPQDLGKGVEMVFKAAERQDMRAQKFLSRLYYQGVGVEQSTHEGELWLAKAADSGHPEAKRIHMQLLQIKAMKDDFKVEAEKDKKYIILFVGIAIFFVVLLWLLIKFAS